MMAFLQVVVTLAEASIMTEIYGLGLITEVIAEIRVQITNQGLLKE